MVIFQKHNLKIKLCDGQSCQKFQARKVLWSPEKQERALNGEGAERDEERTSICHKSRKKKDIELIH